MTPDDAGAVERAANGAVRFDSFGAIREIVLTRADKLNAINSDVLAGLGAAISSIDSDPTIRAVIVRGEGRVFSAGGDLDEVAALSTDRAAFDSFLDTWHAVFAAIEASPVPFIAAVHGVVFAGGLELMQVCDFVVAGDATKIGDQHANFGIFPAGGSTQRLPRLMPRRIAKWYLMSGEQIAPDDAQRYGLVNRVVPEAEVLDEARRMAAVLAARSPRATAAIKRAVRAGDALGIDAALAAERSTVLDHAASEDFRIGIEAFRTRTTPTFPDRPKTDQE